MAKKFEIVGQALVITDDSIPKVIFDSPKGEVYYDSDLLINDGIIKINNIDALDNVSKTAPKILLSDAVDDGDVSFSEATFMDFARTNLGFKTASGGSGADGDDGDSAYQVAVNNGFVGTEQEWLDSLVGTDGEDADTTLPKSSTIVTSRDFIITDADGMNEVDNAGNITLTMRLNSVTAFPLWTPIPLKKKAGSSGTVTIAYEAGVTGESGVLYTDKDGGTLWQTATDVWELIGFPKVNLDVLQTDTTTNNAKIGTAPSANTGVVLDLSNPLGEPYNMASANAGTTYTFSGAVVFGWAQSLINTTSEPTVTGATKIAGATWVTGTNMYLVVRHNGTTTEYFFLEI